MVNLMQRRRAMMAYPYVRKRTSGAVVHFEDAAEKNLRHCMVNIEPVQAGSGDPSPENVRPISGWTGIKVTREHEGEEEVYSIEFPAMGKNLFSGKSDRIGHGLSDDGNHVENANYNTWKLTLPSGEYIISGFDSGTGSNKVLRECNYDSDGNMISFYKSASSGASKAQLSFTVPENTSYVLFSIRNSMSDIQVELGSTPTAYEPYNNTVYGGTLDVTKGVLVVDRAVQLLDGAGRILKGSQGGFARYSITPQDIIEFNRGGYASSHFIVSDIPIGSNNKNNVISGHPNGNLYLRADEFETVDDLRDFLSSNPVTYCGYLVTPITYHLTPTQVTALLGTNNIWADTGDAAVTYLSPKPTFEEKVPINSASSYKAAMRQYFRIHGATTATPEQLTALCDKWYSKYRNGWNGYTEFPLPDTVTGSDTGSYGTKKGSNAGLVAEPSTDTVAGRDDYAGLPQFAPTDCNWVLDDEGNILVTDIDGVTDNFERDNPNRFVGVLQMSMYHYWYDTDTTYVHGLSDAPLPFANIKPYPEAVKLDGTMRPWVCHSKYLSKTINGRMTCCSGNIPTAFISHNTLVTLPDSIGPQYSGGTETDWSFLYLMAMIKYGAITLDNNIQGCVNHNYQYYSALGETDVKRVLLTTAQAANFPVGSSVIIGTYNGSSTDRGTAANYSITTNSGALVTAVENVTIGGTTYGAVYVDTPNTFNTTANGSAVQGSTIISTWHWRTGTTDKVKGNDGSIVNSKNGKYPAKLQGIEYAMGGYEVSADSIMNIKDGVYEEYIAKRTAYQATSVTANMVKSTLTSLQPEANAWQYIRRQEYDGETGIFFPTDTAGASGKFTRDGFYKNGTSQYTTGTRENLRFGTLNHGVGNGGLSSLHGNHALSSGNWGCLSRLSPNGNRG